MQIHVVTPPAVEPVTLAEVKRHLRIEQDFTDDDTDLTCKLTAARVLAESLIERAAIDTTLDVMLDSFPTGDGEIRLPIAAAQSVTWIRWTSTGGTVNTLDTTAYVFAAGSPGRVRPAPGRTWPVPRQSPGAVTIRYLAGYGSTAAAVPETFKSAVKLYAAQLYEHREPVVVGAGLATAEVPHSIRALLSTLAWGEVR
jgi:uncharacterized phiE125 gp8 family phage protein